MNTFKSKQQATEIRAVQILLWAMKVLENESENSESNKTNKCNMIEAKNFINFTN